MHVTCGEGAQYEVVCSPPDPAWDLYTRLSDELARAR